MIKKLHSTLCGWTHKSNLQEK